MTYTVTVNGTRWTFASRADMEQKIASATWVETALVRDMATGKVATATAAQILDLYDTNNLLSR